MYFSELLLIVGSPTAWVALALIVIIIFAPRILPSLAKFAGRLMQREVRRRLGVPEPDTPPYTRTRTTVEVMPPPTPRRSEAQSRPAAEIIDAEPIPRRKATYPFWLITAGAVFLLAVVSWILFHSR